MGEDLESQEEASQIPGTSASFTTFRFLCVLCLLRQWIVARIDPPVWQAFLIRGEPGEVFIDLVFRGIGLFLFQKDEVFQNQHIHVGGHKAAVGVLG